MGKAVFSAMTRVYVSELATGTTQRLTHVDTPREFQPVWSPNGGAIAFVTWSENGGEVWKAADAALTQLTKQTAYYHDPVWTPDGSGVVVMRARTQDRRANAQPPREDVVLIRDGEVQRIAVADGLGSPHFAKEVDRVYLYSAQQGLVSVKLDGTDKRQEVKPNGAQEIRAGPDGLHAVERFNNELYLFERSAAQTFDLKAAKRLTLYGADSFAWAGPRTVTWGLGASLFRFDLETGRTEETSLVVERPRTRPVGTVVLRSANLITMRGAQVVRNADVVIKDNRILAVGPRGRVRLPAGARVMDVAGDTIMPGLIEHMRTSMFPEGWLIREPGSLPRIWPMG